jgi:hypothetical protein
MKILAIALMTVLFTQAQAQTDANEAEKIQAVRAKAAELADQSQELVVLVGTSKNVDGKMVSSLTMAAPQGDEKKIDWFTTNSGMAIGTHHVLSAGFGTINNRLVVTGGVGNAQGDDNPIMYGATLSLSPFNQDTTPVYIFGEHFRAFKAKRASFDDPVTNRYTGLGVGAKMPGFHDGQYFFIEGGIVREKTTDAYGRNYKSGNWLLRVGVNWVGSGK